MNELANYVKVLDKVIGNRIYSSRTIMGISRKDLAHAVGVSIQQLCKYETGINRVSAGRLVLIAKKLGQQINYFYPRLQTKQFQPKKFLDNEILDNSQVNLNLLKNLLKMDMNQQNFMLILVNNLLNFKWENKTKK